MGGRRNRPFGPGVSPQWWLFTTAMIAASFQACFAAASFPPKATEDTPLKHTYEPVAAPSHAYLRMVFEQGEEPICAVRLSPPTAGDLQAKIRDFRGHEVGGCTVEAGRSAGEYLLSPKVKAVGWYRIDLEMNGQPVERRPGDEASMETYSFLPFAIVPRPERNRASPFGLDAAISSSRGFSREGQIELARLSGVGWIRDRLDWTSINPAPGDFQWGPARDVAAGAVSRGLKVLQVFQNSPAWTRLPGTSGNSYPTDLFAAFTFAKKSAEVFGESVAAYEVWNEHDIAHFATDPPDIYASLLKAMSLGYQSAAIRPLILLGPFARHPEVGGYAGILAANEVAPWVDAYSFHTYHPVKGGAFEEVLQTHLAVADQLGMAGKPVWLTEYAHPYARNTVPDPQQTMADQVNYFMQATAIAFARGVRPTFPFMMRPWFGGGPSQFGFLDSHYCPFPVFVALAVMCRQLGDAGFAGTSTSEDAQIFHFKNHGRPISLVVPDSPGDIVRIPDPGPDATATGAMGNPLAIDRESESPTVSSGGFPFYIANPAWQSVDAPAAGKVREPIPPPPPVVLLARYPRECVDFDEKREEIYWDGLASKWAPRGYVLAAPTDIDAEVDVFNFGPGTAQGEIQMRLPHGLTAEPEVAAVDVPSFQKQTVKFRVTATAEAASGLWQVVGKVGGLAVSPSAARWTRVKPEVSPTPTDNATGEAPDL